MAEVTHERLRHLLDYDQSSGAFAWRTTTTNRVATGSKAGYASGGYVMIGIDGVRYGAHRLAIFYVTGAMPEGEVDHINGNRCDNRIANLRSVSHMENMQNERKPRSSNRSGLLGVSLCSQTGRYRAFISINGKSVSVGRFDTPEKAYDAYVAAKRQRHAGSTL